MNTFISLIRDSLFSIIFHLAPRFANVLLFILIGRLAGPTEAGIFTLATTYLLIFTTIMRGIDDLVVRQVSREPRFAARYLTNFLILRLGLSLLLYGMLWFLAVVIFDYAEHTTQPILILGISLIPDSLTFVAQSILLGRRQFRQPALVFTGISVFKLAIGGIALIGNGDLLQIAWIWLIGSVLGTAVMLTATIKSINGIEKTDWFTWDPLKLHWKAAFTFLLLTTLATLETQTDTILLSGFHDEKEVGWYGAATTIAYSLIMFSQAYRFAIYPLMSRYALQHPEKLGRLYSHSMRYLGMIVLPMIAGIALLSSQIVPLVFGSQFQPTVTVLQILVFTLFFVFLNEPNIRIMLVHDRQNQISLFLLASAGVNIILNLLLTPSWGAVGAATARVCSAMVLFSLNFVYTLRFFARVNLLKLLNKPMLATLVMVLVILPIRTWPLAISIGAGILAYGIALIVVGSISPTEINLVYQAMMKRARKTTSQTDH